jgi:hypothetical protein
MNAHLLDLRKITDMLQGFFDLINRPFDARVLEGTIIHLKGVILGHRKTFADEVQKLHATIVKNLEDWLHDKNTTFRDPELENLLMYHTVRGKRVGRENTN